MATASNQEEIDRILGAIRAFSLEGGDEDKAAAARLVDKLKGLFLDDPNAKKAFEAVRLEFDELNINTRVDNGARQPSSTRSFSKNLSGFMEGPTRRAEARAAFYRVTGRYHFLGVSDFVKLVKILGHSQDVAIEAKLNAKQAGLFSISTDSVPLHAFLDWYESWFQSLPAKSEESILGSTKLNLSSCQKNNHNHTTPTKSETNAPNIPFVFSASKTCKSSELPSDVYSQFSSLFLGSISANRPSSTETVSSAKENLNAQSQNKTSSDDLKDNWTAFTEALKDLRSGTSKSSKSNDANDQHNIVDEGDATPQETSAQFYDWGTTPSSTISSLRSGTSTPDLEFHSFRGLESKNQTPRESSSFSDVEIENEQGIQKNEKRNIFSASHNQFSNENSDFKDEICKQSVSNQNSNSQSQKSSFYQEERNVSSRKMKGRMRNLAYRRRSTGQRPVSKNLNQRKSTLTPKSMDEDSNNSTRENANDESIGFVPSLEKTAPKNSSKNSTPMFLNLSSFDSDKASIPTPLFVFGKNDSNKNECKCADFSLNGISKEALQNGTLFSASRYSPQVKVPPPSCTPPLFVFGAPKAPSTPNNLPNMFEKSPQSSFFPNIQHPLNPPVFTPMGPKSEGFMQREAPQSAPAFMFSNWNDTPVPFLPCNSPFVSADIKQSNYQQNDSARANPPHFVFPHELNTQPSCFPGDGTSSKTAPGFVFSSGKLPPVSKFSSSNTTPTKSNIASPQSCFFPGKNRPTSTPFFSAPAETKEPKSAYFPSDEHRKTQFRFSSTGQGNVENKSTDSMNSESFDFAEQVIGKISNISISSKTLSAGRLRRQRGKEKETRPKMSEFSRAEFSVWRNDSDRKDDKAEIPRSCLEFSTRRNSYAETIAEAASRIKVNKELIEEATNKTLIALQDQLDNNSMQGSNFYSLKEYGYAIDFFEHALKSAKEMQKYGTDNKSKIITLICNKAAALIMLEMYEAAAKECDNALYFDKNAIKPMTRKARALLLAGDLDEAEIFYKKASEKAAMMVAFGNHSSPSDPENYYKYTNECRTGFRNVSDASRWLAESEYFEQKEEYAKALREADAALNISPGLQLAHKVKVNALQNLRRYEESVKACVNLAVLIDLSNNELRGKVYKGGYSRSNLPPYSLCAIILHQTSTDFWAKWLVTSLRYCGKLNDAIECLEALNNASASWASNDLVHCQTAKSKKEAADNAYRRGDYIEAAAAYTAALRHDIKNNYLNAQLLCNRAAARMAMNRDIEAVADCSEAMKLCPSYHKAVLRRARAFRALSKWHSATADYETYKKLHREFSLEYEIELSKLNQEISTLKAEMNMAERKERLHRESKKPAGYCRRSEHVYGESYNHVDDSDDGNSSWEYRRTKYYDNYSNVNSSRRNSNSNSKPSKNRRESTSQMTGNRSISCHYSILGIARTASNRDIRQAYRKLALQYHPDKNSAPEASDKFKQITEAYEVLGDDATRKKYDTDRRLGL